MTDHRVQQAEVAVIGGGVVGTAVAFHLAALGKDVCLLERGDVASGASGSCDGYLFLLSKVPGPHLQLARESLRLHQELAASEGGSSLEFRQDGGMLVARSEEAWDGLKGLVQRQREYGIPVELLERDEALSRQPALSPRIRGAAFSTFNGQVNPVRLAHYLARQAEGMGARMMVRSEVLAVEHSPGTGYRLLLTEGRTLRARVLVNAAGAWADPVARLAGFRLPVIPRRGQVAVTEAVDPLLNTPMLEAGYLAVKFSAPGQSRSPGGVPPAARPAGIAFGVEQTAAGNLLIGSSREEAGFDRRTNPAVIGSILRNALEFLPSLNGLKIIRTYAGLRPRTPDGLPLLGPLPGRPDYFTAVGHEGDGVTLAPVTGRLLAEWIVFGEPSLAFPEFAPERFGGFGRA